MRRRRKRYPTRPAPQTAPKLSPPANPGATGSLPPSPRPKPRSSRILSLGRNLNRRSNTKANFFGVWERSRHTAKSSVLLGTESNKQLLHKTGGWTMPNRDRTGPAGTGEKSGGQKGSCPGARASRRPQDGKGKGKGQGKGGERTGKGRGKDGERTGKGRGKDGERERERAGTVEHSRQHNGYGREAHFTSAPHAANTHES